jgi:hypothetical protein
MWWLDAFRANFPAHFPLAPLCIFRILFACACLQKFFVETKRGYYFYYEPHTFLYVQRQFAPGILRVSPAVYKTLYVLKFFAAFFLLLGIAPQFAAAILMTWFIVESAVYFKFHVSYFALLSGALALSPGLGAQLSFNPGQSAAARTGDGFGPFLIITTTVFLYLVTALRKAQSIEFTSGGTLAASFHALQNERSYKHHAEGWYPAPVVKYFDCMDEERARRRWRPFALATIAIELALPLLLLATPISQFGAALGILFHCCVTFLLPLTLTHFSLATISTYVLFLDPHFVEKVFLHWSA